MLHANDIVPRNPEPLRPQEHALDTLPTSEMSTGKGENSKVKKEAEVSSDTEDDDSMIREKALLVRFIFHVLDYWQFIIDFDRPSLRKLGREGRRIANVRKKG